MSDHSSSRSVTDHHESDASDHRSDQKGGTSVNSSSDDDIPSHDIIWTGKKDVIWSNVFTERSGKDTIAPCIVTQTTTVGDLHVREPFHRGRTSIIPVPDIRMRVFRPITSSFGNTAQGFAVIGKQISDEMCKAATDGDASLAIVERVLKYRSGCAFNLNGNNDRVTLHLNHKASSVDLPILSFPGKLPGEVSTNKCVPIVSPHIFNLMSSIFMDVIQVPKSPIRDAIVIPLGTQGSGQSYAVQKMREYLVSLATDRLSAAASMREKTQALAKRLTLITAANTILCSLVNVKHSKIVETVSEKMPENQQHHDSDEMAMTSMNPQSMSERGMRSVGTTFFERHKIPVAQRWGSTLACITTKMELGSASQICRIQYGIANPVLENVLIDLRAEETHDDYLERPSQNGPEGENDVRLSWAKKASRERTFDIFYQYFLWLKQEENGQNFGYRSSLRAAGSPINFMAMNQFPKVLGIEQFHPEMDQQELDALLKAFQLFGVNPADVFAKLDVILYLSMMIDRVDRSMDITDDDWLELETYFAKSEVPSSVERVKKLKFAHEESSIDAPVEEAAGYAPYERWRIKMQLAAEYVYTELLGDLERKINEVLYKEFGNSSHDRDSSASSPVASGGMNPSMRKSSRGDGIISGSVTIVDNLGSAYRVGHDLTSLLHNTNVDMVTKYRFSVMIDGQNPSNFNLEYLDDVLYAERAEADVAAFLDGIRGIHRDTFATKPDLSREDVEQMQKIINKMTKRIFKDNEEKQRLNGISWNKKTNRLTVKHQKHMAAHEYAIDLAFLMRLLNSSDGRDVVLSEKRRREKTATLLLPSVKRRAWICCCLRACRSSTPHEISSHQIVEQMKEAKLDLVIRALSEKANAIEAQNQPRKVLIAGVAQAPEDLVVMSAAVSLEYVDRKKLQQLSAKREFSDYIFLNQHDVMSVIEADMVGAAGDSNAATKTRMVKRLQRAVRCHIARRRMMELESLKHAIQGAVEHRAIEKLEVLVRHCKVNGINWPILQEARKCVDHVMDFRGHTAYKPNPNAGMGLSLKEVRRRKKEERPNMTVDAIPEHDTDFWCARVERDEYRARSIELERMMQVKQRQLRYEKQRIAQQAIRHHFAVERDLENSLEILHRFTESILPFAEELLEKELAEKEDENGADAAAASGVSNSSGTGPVLQSAEENKPQVTADKSDSLVVRSYLKTVLLERNKFRAKEEIFSDSVQYPPNLEDVHPKLKRFVSPWVP